MTAYLRALTPRGRALLAAGAVGAALSWGAGQPALLAVAVLLGLLPILGLVTVHRSRFLLGSARSASPVELPFGSDGEVVLTLANASRLPTGALLLEDRVPESLGSSPRLLLDRVQPRSRRTVRYPIHGRRRGLAHIGPLTVGVTDPFGTARREQPFTTTTAVLVTPQIVPLPSTTASVMSGGRGDARLRALAARGEDDVLPREHRPGDDMRRIHWRATARQGALMVRREEVAWHSAITVILDDRARAYEGSGSTFEWAVSAAASIAVHHCRQGWHVLALTATGQVLADTAGASSLEEQALVRAYAEVRTREAPMTERPILDPDGTAAVVAVMGRLGEDGARTLARPMTARAACLLLDPAPVDLLRAQGWRAAGWTRATPVDDAWLRIAPLATVVGSR